MHILYLNHYAGSPRHGMEYRPYYLAREWLRAGHGVRMLAADYSHVRATQPDLVALAQAKAAHAGRAIVQDIDGIAYHWYRTPPYSGNGLGRVKNIWAFLRQVWRDAPRIAREFQPDVVIASSTYPMDIWVAHRIARLVRKAGKPCKLVFEVHDLWPLSPIELGGMSPRHPFIMLCQAAEDYAYQHADVVVSMLPKVAAHMQAHGLDLRKLHIVPNGIDPDEWHGQAAPLDEALSNRFAQLRSQGARLVGYAGAHGVANALEALLDASALLDDGRIQTVLVGTGPDKDKLKALASQKNMRNVHFMEPVAKHQMPALLAHFDIAYIGLQNQPLFRFGIAPNKLMDYMMAGRPVVMAIAAGNDPVAESGCGLTAMPENPQAIAQAVRQLLQLPESSRMEMGQKGRAFVMQHHSYPVLAQRFLTACLPQ